MRRPAERDADLSPKGSKSFELEQQLVVAGKKERDEESTIVSGERSEIEGGVKVIKTADRAAADRGSAAS